MSRICLATAAAAAMVAFEGAAVADPANPSNKAKKIAQDTIILDGHVDIPYRLQATPEDIGVRTARGDFDYVRAMEGGLNAPFMSIYVAADFQETPGAAKEQADKLIDLVEGLEEAHPDKFEVAHSTADVKRITGEGKIALPMGMENGAPIENDLANLDYFHERGIRYITLTHSRANAISDSSYDINRPHGGLSAFGETVVKRMNELGIMVDISHVSDDAFWDVMELTDVPVIASHSSARKYTSGFERNMNDEMIQRLGEERGVIMINFGSAFLTETYTEWRNKYRAAFAAYLKANDLEGTDAIEDAFEAGYTAVSPKPYATVEDVLDHIDHAVALAGIDHVGLGSDFDGVGDSLPTHLKDASMMPNLIQGLLDRGYDRNSIEKILSGNAMRVWSEVEAAAGARTGDKGE